MGKRATYHGVCKGGVLSHTACLQDRSSTWKGRTRTYRGGYKLDRGESPRVNCSDLAQQMTASIGRVHPLRRGGYKTLLKVSRELSIIPPLGSPAGGGTWGNLIPLADHGMLTGLTAWHHDMVGYTS